jgi:hypothetical protein
MRCPDLSTLRASLDGVPLDHASSCPDCAETLGELRRNAELAAPAIALAGPDPDVSPGPAAVEQALASVNRRRSLADPVTEAVPLPPRRRWLASPALTRAAAALVAVVVLGALVGTPGGRSAAAGFLSHFRSERFQVVALGDSQAAQLGMTLSQLVDIGVFRGDQEEVSRLAEPTEAGDRAEASRLAGFEVDALSRAALPGGVEPSPARILVNRAHTATITFDRAKALAYFASNGKPGMRIPERYDGAKLVVHVPAAVVQEYTGRDGAPKLLVGKAGSLAVDAAGGASLDELRELLLELPGLPAELVEQLRSTPDWQHTLPLPVPTDQVDIEHTSVGGAEALSFTEPASRVRGLLWRRDDGIILGVAGLIDADEALHVANALH